MKFALGTTFACLMVLAAHAAFADFAAVGASKDNTLYLDGTGGLSNGAGAYLFAGQAGSVRRGLLAFDVASAVPAGSTIQSVTLTLHCSRAPFLAPAVACTLNRVLANWGEGASDAGDPGGTGTAAAPGDATWIHTFFPGSLWTTPGGDFDATVSASQNVGDAGTYVWGSTAQMVADVQSWLDTPATSYGWIVRGVEGGGSNARRFDTKENALTENRPILGIQYTTGLVGVESAPWSGVKALYR